MLIRHRLIYELYKQQHDMESYFIFQIKCCLHTHVFIKFLMHAQFDVHILTDCGISNTELNSNQSVKVSKRYLYEH